MAIIDRYAGFVIDLDGVVFRGSEPVRSAAGLLRRLQRLGVPAVFVTNNSTRTPQEWVTTLERARIRIAADRILTSADATARLLADDPSARCFVVGEYGLATALRRAGLVLVESAADADTVVVGWDQHLTFAKLKEATLAIARGARFVGTNPDPIYPGHDGPWPGTGATLAFLREATGVAAEVVGKPQSPLFELAGELLDVDGPILVVGDQVETDVIAANRMGWDSALVLSGVADWWSLVGAAVQPSWVVPSLGDLDGPEPPIVRPAREADLSSIRSILASAGLDASQAARRLRETLVAVGPDDVVVGTAAWEIVDRAGHLRGIAVAPHERGHGTGSHLVVRALDALQRAGVQWVYLLTPGADMLFEKLGFWRVHRDRVPEEILSTAQFGAAASGSVALLRRLTPTRPTGAPAR